MIRLPNPILQAFVLFAAMVCLTQTTRAQDPVKVDPEHYKVIEENDAVRILEFRDTPGHKVPKHSHPPYFVYVLSDAKRLFTDECVTPKTVILTKGETIDSKVGVTHCEENTGYTNTHVLIVEFKNAPNKVRRSSRARRQHGVSPPRRFNHQVTID
jgi:quercetin dioxygenase-like cupin family protein